MLKAAPGNLIEDASLAEDGARRVAWTRGNMPLLAGLRAEFAAELPLKDRQLGMCLHVEPKTAVLVEVLRAGGAQVFITGSPATTDDGVAAFLTRDEGVRVYARKADTLADHHRHIDRVLSSDPDLLLDNGADLIAEVTKQGSRVTAATEETTTGANRLRAELAAAVPFPVIVVNDSPLKLLIENLYGVGPTVVEGFMRATNCVVATSTFAVVGYGSCGRGVARSLRALGASVIVVERDPVRALEAAFDGMRVMNLGAALRQAGIVITVTGRPGILRGEELLELRDGTLLANAGHFGLEIDVPALAQLAVSAEPITAQITEYRLADGRRIRLLGRGEMLNLTAATGNQIQVMDLGFAIQAHSLRALAAGPGRFPAGPQPVPADINRRIGVDLLKTLSVVVFESESDYA
jgi:adenosylhomocysteinase